MAKILQANLIDKSRVGTDQQIADLLAQLNAIRNTASMDRNNPLCWRSAYRYSNINWLLDEIKDSVKQSIETYKDDAVFYNSIISDNFSINYWTNINQPGSRNVIHAHSSASLSGVYYIQGTGTGELRILNPANVLGTCHEKSPFVRDFVFDPKDKDLIMWPSWLPHEVETNLTNKERINIAYDITFL
jgi:uncharacterized protein (TIGR02466 family)